MKAGSITMSVFLLKCCFLIRFQVQLLEIMLALCVFVLQPCSWQPLATYSCADDNVNAGFRP